MGCLSTEAIGDDEGSGGGSDYGKISKAIYKMKKHGIQVSPPSINADDIDFTCNPETDKIYFGLGAIAGLGTEVCNQIIRNKPYTSFKDFYNKNYYKGSLITKSKMKALIKAGCFDEFNPDRIKIMKQFVVLSGEVKDNLTLANVRELKKLKVKIPKELTAPYFYKQYVCNKQFYYSNHPNFKSKKLYWLDDRALKYFNQNCRDNMKEGIDFWEENDKIVIVDKSLEKFYKPTMEQLKAYIATDEVKKEYRKASLKQQYYDLIDNDEDVNRWSFETLSYYSNEHELSKVDMKRYSISRFSDLPEEPVFIEKTVRGRTYREYEISCIMGTVIAKNDANSLVTILTNDNEIVNVKMQREKYAYYKSQISIIDESGNKKVMDKSWLSRGTRVIIVGYRRGSEDFICKKYKNTVYQHSVMKINEVFEDGSVDVSFEKYSEEE